MVLSLKAVRVTYGETVTFRGLPYRVTTKAVAGAKAGEQAVPRGVFGVFVADTSPRSYNFTPTDFAPTTNVPPPIEGEEITRNGLVNVITAVDYINVDTDTVAIICYALRKVWGIAFAP